MSEHALLERPATTGRLALHVVRDGATEPAGHGCPLPLSFGILGPLDVGDGVRSIDLGAPKQRAVLAVLLLQANTVVSLDGLVDELWGEAPPPQAVGCLQVYIYNLRRVLEPDRAARAPGRRLVSKAPGYMLVVDPDSYDAARFESLAAMGGRLLREGRPRSAHGALTQALGLWRGPALAEFAFEPFARAEAARLEEVRAVALEDRVEADLALGHHAAAVAELEGLVARYPLRERLWAALMTALYRSGRQAEALRAYRNCRATLLEELGIDPGPALRRQEQAILAQAPSLDWRPAAEHIAVPPPAAIVPRPSPGPPVERRCQPLVGRAEPLGRLEALLDGALAGQGGLALVTGDAGMGKTRLVEELAVLAADRDVVVAWGRAHDGQLAPSLWPWAQILRRLLTAQLPDDLEMALAPARAALGPLLPGPGGLVTTPSTGGEGNGELAQALVAVLLALAGRGGLVLVLDDLQWADAASLQLLEFLVPELAAAPVLVVAAYRDREVEAAHPLARSLASFARHGVLERIVLGPLAEAEVGSVIAGSSGTEPPPALVSAVHRRTDGNPFFLAELVRLLEREGALRNGDIEAANSCPVPPGVRDVVRWQIARLPEPTRALLGEAAMLGQDFELGLLEAVAGLEGDVVLERLEPAVIADVVSQCTGTPARYRFAHAFVRETLCGGAGRPSLVGVKENGLTDGIEAWSRLRY